jgi:ribosomal protein S18 acetylase RimI-like enzyme
MILLNLSKEEDFSILKTALSSEFAKDALLSPNLKDKIKLAYAIMNDTNNPIGIGGFYIQRYFFYDLYIAIHKSERGKGIGKKLLDSIVESCLKEKIVMFIQTYTYERYSPAISLYEKKGFKTIGTFKNKIIMCNQTAGLGIKFLRLCIFYIENLLRYIRKPEELND